MRLSLILVPRLFIRQRFDAGELLAFEEFKRWRRRRCEMWVIWSATPALLMAETESPPPMMEVAVRLAATALAMALVPTAKRGNSKTPAGPFQTMVRAVETTSSMAAMDLGPMSRPCQSAGKSTEQSHGWVLASAAKLVGQDVVDGQQQLDALGLGFLERVLGHVDLVFFDEALAGGHAQRALEGVSHAADDHQRVDLVEQVVDHVDFAGDLGAADDGHEGLLGRFEGLAEVGDFLFHQQAGHGGLEEVRDALGGGVGAMGASRRRR